MLNIRTNLILIISLLIYLQAKPHAIINSTNICYPINQNFIVNKYHSNTTFSGIDSNKYYRQILDINKAGMLVLSSWAVSNILSGFYYSNSTTLSVLKYFWKGNIYWNFVNLGIAGMGIYHSLVNYNLPITINQLYRKQQNIEKIYLFNAGLDVAYFFAGLYLNEKANNVTNTAQLSGYGTAMMLQAAFLVSFDLAMYLMHHKHAKKKLYHF